MDLQRQGFNCLMDTLFKPFSTSGDYSTTSEYIRQLIRQDRQQKAEKQLEQLLLEGLNSGEATPMTAKDWAEIRQVVTDKIAARKNNRVG